MNSWQAIEIGDALDAVVAFVVLLLYWRALIGMKLQMMTPVDSLIAGICLTWTGTFIDRLWRLLWRVNHHPGWMQGSPILLFSLLVVAVGGVLHISAKHENGFRPIQQSWRVLVATFSVGILAGVAAVWMTEGPR